MLCFASSCLLLISAASCVENLLFGWHHPVSQPGEEEKANDVHYLGVAKVAQIMGRIAHYNIHI